MSKSNNPKATSKNISNALAIDLTGQKFGKVEVIRRDYTEIGRGGARWLCRCECGTEFVTLCYYLRKGDTKSCGCLKLKYKKKNTNHGLSRHPLYPVHGDMLGRCLNPNDQEYERYGARGIQVCNEWKEDFLSFYNWALKNGYQQGLFLDRRNNDGNYCPENCRWITQAESNNNMRRHGGWKHKSNTKRGEA